MSEYIKKEDALQALHDFWDECIGYDGSGAEMMLDNESVINSLPTYSFPDSAENKGEWIPVSERLPEPNRLVVCYITTEITKTYFIAFWNDIQKAWEEGIGGCRLLERDLGYKVIAWQPLPEPYKKGE